VDADTERESLAGPGSFLWVGTKLGKKESAIHPDCICEGNRLKQGGHKDFNRSSVGVKESCQGETEKKGAAKREGVCRMEPWKASTGDLVRGKIIPDSIRGVI